MLRIRQVGGRLLILDFLLGDLLLQFRRIQLDQNLLALHIRFSDEIPFLNNLQNLRALMAHADFAFDFLRFQRLQAAPFEHIDLQRPAPRGEGKLLHRRPAAARPPPPAEQNENGGRCGHFPPARLTPDEIQNFTWF